MSTEADLPVEHADEPVIAWRCWYVNPRELTLRPVYKRRLRWMPRQAHVAICPEKDILGKGPKHSAPAPAAGCKCGIYAVCHPKLLREGTWDIGHGVVVIGQVALWGKVIELRRGWRAQYAYPKHLYAFTDETPIAHALRDRYLVPVAYGAEAEPLRKSLPKAERGDAHDSWRKNPPNCWQAMWATHEIVNDLEEAMEDVRRTLAILEERTRPAAGRQLAGLGETGGA